MTSPDLTDLIDLVLYDADPTTLVERAVLDAAVKLPEWIPLEGNTEMVLIEGLALEVTELVYAVNRLPSGVLDVLLRLFGITRGLGVPATATVRFNLAVSTGLTIPAGTVVRLDLGDGAFLDFATDADATAAPAATSVTAPVTALTATSSGNGVVSGTALTLQSSVAYVDTVVFTTDVAAGADPETSAEWRARSVAVFQGLSNTLVKPTQFTAAALATVGISRAFTIDNYNGGVAPGHVSVAVLGPGGATLSGGAKTALQTTLTANTQVNLAVHVIDPTITVVPVTSTVKAKAGYSSATVQANILAALNTYLNPETWEWAATVRINELIALIDNTEGVDYVVSIAAPAGDVALAGAAPLADLGAVTTNVT